MIQEIADLIFHDRLEKRDKWMKIFEDPVWKPIFDAPLPAHRQLAYNQLKKVAKSGIVSVLNFIDDPTNIFTAHQMIGMVNGSTVTKFTVHYNLFGGSLVALHTERHKKIFQKVDKLDITGCFCLTQLGFGNNAVQMETTATYDDKKQQFIVNSPTTLSQKYWITNGSVHANLAVVFAQTIVKGKNQGINAFLVPIRNQKLEKCQNVQINQMGYKMGLNGVDNAALKFHNVRIPRQNMLNRYCDVNQNGEFKSDLKGIQQRFFKVTERLLSGRLCIASMTMGALRRQLYVTIKYSKQRMGVSPNGKSQTPIFEYQLQKNALMPIVSRTLALSMLHNYSKKVFANPKGHENDLLMICCIDKTLVGWHAQRSGALMRERCGGQGFLAANAFGQFMAASHAALTAQGDNRVLMIKVVKDMLTIFKKNPEAYYNGENITIKSIDQLSKVQNLVTLLEMQHKNLLMGLINKMMKLKGDGKSNYDILMFQTSDQIQALAQGYGETIAIKAFRDSISNLSPQAKSLMQDHLILFAWQILIRDSASYLIEGWIDQQVIKSLRDEYNNLIKKAAKTVDNIIESFNIPVHAIYAPIAKDYVLYNKQSYEGEVVNAKM